MRYLKKCVLFAALPLLVFPACDREPAVPEPDPPVPPGNGGGGTPSAEYGWAELPVMEGPGGVVYVTHYVSADGAQIVRPDAPGRVRNYSIGFDEARRQPLWVAAPMHRWYRSPRNTNRTDRWAYDPYVPQDAQPDLTRSYRPVGANGSFSRGHLVASADRLREWALNAQTFYYTNMAPQVQDGFNDGIWSALEAKVQLWGDAWADTLYVVTGSAFVISADVAFKVTSDNSGNTIPVPTHFYKVLLRSRDGNTGRSVAELAADELMCVGFWLEHAVSTEPVSEEFMMSVADVEQLVGLSFFPILSEDAASVKNTYNAADWGL